MWIVDSRQMAALDARTIDEIGLPGVILMERAALAVVAAAQRHSPQPGRALVLVGQGNNGGDGLAIARLLVQRGWRVEVALCADPERLRGDARTNLEAARRLGVPIGVHSLDPALDDADVWIDALLGTGASGAPTGLIGDAIECVGRARERRAAYTIAVDLPSGVNASTGQVEGFAITADVTVTFGCAKWGHFLPPGLDHIGALEVADIGIPDHFSRDIDGAGRVFTEHEAAVAWTPVARSAHKGSMGHVLVVGGSEATPGAVILAATAALRAGAGKVTVAADPGVRRLAVAARPELMVTTLDDAHQGGPDLFDALVIGPGFGRTDARRREVEGFMRRFTGRPVVVDADGLFALGELDGATLLGPDVILTPHPGELGRLLGRSTGSVLGDFVGAAVAAQARAGSTVVAKTAGALIADTELSFVCAGHPGMATAGSGDVLAGVIGALCCRTSAPLAARLGAWLHSRAGAEAGRVRGGPSLIASDIVDKLGAAFIALERGP